PSSLLSRRRDLPRVDRLAGLLVPRVLEREGAQRAVALVRAHGRPASQRIERLPLPPRAVATGAGAGLVDPDVLVDDVLVDLELLEPRPGLRREGLEHQLRDVQRPVARPREAGA